MNSQPKKVLIISYYWPPSGGSGVQRWLKMVKYMREFGWEPVIYTPENPEYPAIDETLLQDVLPEQRIIRSRIWEPYTFYKRFVGLKKEDKINVGFLTEKKKNPLLENVAVWLRGNLFIPDARKFWIKPSIQFLSGILENEHFDAVISTGPPHSMHLIANGLHEKNKIPWLADFCDPWTRIDFYDQLKLGHFADRKHHRLEKLVLRNANAVSAVTPTMIAEFSEEVARNYALVTNGYDEADFETTTPELDRKFSIAHIGSIVPTRNPEKLWKIIAELVTKDADFAEKLEIKLVGKVDVSVLRSIHEAGLEKHLRKIDYLPHDQAIEELIRSQLLLLLINQTPNANGILTGKLFEYLAAERPILCLGPVEGDAAAILSETESGKIFSYQDEAGIRKALQESFELFKRTGLLPCSKAYEKYSWRRLSGNVAAILDSLQVHP